MSDAPWIVEQVRITAFYDAAPTGEGLWTALTGEAPNEIKNQPKEQVVSEEGGAWGGVLRVERRVGRIDVMLIAEMPTPEAILSQPTLWPTLGDFETALAGLLPGYAAWIQRAGVPPKRLALGTTALLPAETHQEGYQALSRLLPAVDVDPSTSDFNYQINRRRVSRAVANLPLNRLSRWAVVRRDMRLHLGSVLELGPTVTSYAARVELDVNTVADHSKNPLEIDDVPAILGELKELSDEILRTGDVP